MAAEYTYFRAEGLSLSSLETVAEAEAEVEGLKDKVAKKFGARSMRGWIDGDKKRFTVHYFTFDAPQAPPAGWTDRDGKPLDPKADPKKTIYAMPAPGTPDHFHMVNMAGLMERAEAKTKLEKALGSAPMPSREVPENSWSSPYFVRFSARAETEVTPEKPPGAIREDNFADCSLSGGRCWKHDPLKVQQLDGAWYIRVPNKPGLDSPCFTPPDAVRISYEEALAADGRERQKRFNLTRAAAFTPNGF